MAPPKREDGALPSRRGAITMEGPGRTRSGLPCSVRAACRTTRDRIATPSAGARTMRRIRADSALCDGPSAGLRGARTPPGRLVDFACWPPRGMLRGVEFAGVPRDVRLSNPQLPANEEASCSSSAEDVDASCGPSVALRAVWTRPGQVLRTCPPLAHTRRPRAHSLTASTTTIHAKDDGSGSGRLPESSLIPGNPSAEQSGQIAWASHERKRETTISSAMTCPTR